MPRCACCCCGLLRPKGKKRTTSFLAHHIAGGQPTGLGVSVGLLETELRASLAVEPTSKSNVAYVSSTSTFATTCLMRQERPDIRRKECEPHHKYRPQQAIGCHRCRGLLGDPARRLVEFSAHVIRTEFALAFIANQLDGVTRPVSTTVGVPHGWGPRLVHQIGHPTDGRQL